MNWLKRKVAFIKGAYPFFAAGDQEAFDKYKAQFKEMQRNGTNKKIRCV